MYSYIARLGVYETLRTFVRFDRLFTLADWRAALLGGEPTSPDAGRVGVIVRRAAARRQRDEVPLRVGPALGAPLAQWLRRSDRVVCRSASVTKRLTSLGQSRVCAQAGEDALADDGPPSAKLSEPGYYHIPSPVVVECIPAHPPRGPGRIACPGAGQKCCVRSVTLEGVRLGQCANPAIGFT